MAQLSDMSSFLESYRESLEREGRSEQAMTLKGVELFNEDDVRTALGTLEEMNQPDPDCIRLYLLSMMRQFLDNLGLPANAQ